MIEEAQREARAALHGVGKVRCGTLASAASLLASSAAALLMATADPSGLASPEGGAAPGAAAAAAAFLRAAVLQTGRQAGEIVAISMRGRREDTVPD